MQILLYLFSRDFDTQELGIFNKKVENTESQLVVGTRYILKKIRMYGKWNT